MVQGKEVPYGLFLGEVVNFLIVALALFVFIVKFLGWVMRAKKEEVAAPPPSDEGPGAVGGDSRPPESQTGLTEESPPSRSCRLPVFGAVLREGVL